MKHNQNEEASRQHEKGTANQKQTPKGQEGNNDKMGQHGQSGHGHSSQDDQQGKQGSKKHAETGKSK
jgi:hypothetical protein